MYCVIIAAEKAIDIFLCFGLTYEEHSVQYVTCSKIIKMQLDVNMSPPANIVTFRLTLTPVRRGKRCRETRSKQILAVAPKHTLGGLKNNTHFSCVCFFHCFAICYLLNRVRPILTYLIVDVFEGKNHA